MSRRVFADFDAELLLRISNRDDVTPAMRAQFINDAYLMIPNEFVHPELQGTTIELVGLGSPELVPTAGDIWWPMFVQDVKHSRAIDYSSYVRIEATGKVLGDHYGLRRKHLHRGTHLRHGGFRPRTRGV